MSRYLLIALCSVASLFGDVEDYFKPVLNKSDSSKMGNIDFIYLINLDERPEKLSLVLDLLKPYEIYPCRFSAVNGWNLSVEDVNDVGVHYESWMSSGRWATYYPLDGNKMPQHEEVTVPGRTYFCHCLSFGSIGCVLSHLSVLQDALDSGYETIWILEDDIEIIQDPHLLSALIEELDQNVGKDGWDVLFTDTNTKNTEGGYVPCSTFAWRPNYTPSNPYRFAEKIDVGSYFTQIGARYGSYSMILRRSGIKKILNYIKCYHIFLPYDMEYTQPANIRLFGVKEDIVSTQPRAASDNGSPNYILNPVQR
jgi:GR25 family glycosyltransferase involved in LPS biosynthesis